jgi:hypothetical protein
MKVMRIHDDHDYHVKHYPVICNLQFDKDVFNKTGNRKHMLQYRKEISDLSVKRLQDVSTNYIYQHIFNNTYNLNTVLNIHR